MRIIVTGAAGFVGSHLAEQLVAAGHNVLGLDSLDPQESQQEKRHNIKELCSSPLFSLVQQDVRDRAAISGVFAAFNPTTVFHLAALAGVRASCDRVFDYCRTNIDGTANVLAACQHVGAARLVFASSSSVYGSASPLPCSEHDSVVNPLSPYAATKVAGEALCRAYSQMSGLQITCLRLFSVYGPRLRRDLAMRHFAEDIRLGRPIHLLGDGQAKRDYTYVADAVAALVNTLLIESKFEIINVGSGRPVSVLELIRRLEDTLGIKAQLIHRPAHQADAPFTHADIEKARRLLHFSPDTSLEKGIAEFCQWLVHRDDGGATEDQIA